MTKPQLFVLILFSALLSACERQDQAITEPAGEPVGEPVIELDFDVAYLDNQIRPQDDFWNYVNGKWIQATEIPGDRSSYGSAHIINDGTEQQTRSILEEAADRVGATGSERTIGDLYASFMDIDAANANGIETLAPLLDEVAQIEDHDQLIRTLGRMAGLSVTTPIQFYSDGDAYDATSTLIYLWQGGLGLPDRSYYLSDNEKLVTARTNYQAHIEAMFDLVEWPNGTEAAGQIVDLETQIAELQWTRLQNRDRQKIYSNQSTFEEAELDSPGLDLAGWFSGYGIDVPPKLVVGQGTYFAGLGNVLNQTDISVWQTYLKFHVLKSFAPYLGEAIVTENFNFQGRQLRGQTEQPDRWRRGVRFVNQSAGELLGQVYVSAHFTESAKAEISALVENLRQAFGVSIRELPWMGEETKQQALAKLEKFLPKLGYPDTWRDFSGLQTDRSNLVSNVINSREFERDYQLSLLDEPVNKQRWNIYPHMVNAFYRPTHNSITFPAGILQPPMFESGRDPALNYGAIGSVIGHEFSHGFDDQGRNFDGDGMLRNWWSDSDAEEYKERASVLVAQFAAYQPLPDTPINGEQTLGENIGDLAGVTMAYKAFELSGHADGPAIGGFTPRQRFFISYALAWRSKIRDQYLRELLLRDTHAPAEYRVTGILSNMPEFYAAFGVKEGDGMFVAADQRAKIW